MSNGDRIYFLNNQPLFLKCSSRYPSTLISRKGKKIRFPLHMFQLKEYFYPPQRSKLAGAVWTRLLKRLLSMISPGQVILQAIQQVPFEAIVETRWGAWRLLKQCCRFSSHLETISSRQRKCKCKIHDCVKKPQEIESGKLFLVFIFLFSLPAYEDSAAWSLTSCTLMKCLGEMFLIIYTYDVSVQVQTNKLHAWSPQIEILMRSLNIHWGCTSYFVAGWTRA